MNIQTFWDEVVSAKVEDVSFNENSTMILQIAFEQGNQFEIFCSWRLEHLNRVLASYSDDIEILSLQVVPNKQRLYAIRELSGHYLESVTISEQGDLLLRFNEGYCLRVFCDVSIFGKENGGQYDGNWELSLIREGLRYTITHYYQRVDI